MIEARETVATEPSDEQRDVGPSVRGAGWTLIVDAFIAKHEDVKLVETWAVDASLIDPVTGRGAGNTPETKAVRVGVIEFLRDPTKLEFSLKGAGTDWHTIVRGVRFPGNMSSSAYVEEATIEVSGEKVHGVRKRKQSGSCAFLRDTATGASATPEMVAAVKRVGVLRGVRARVGGGSDAA